jgi:hypothetical protein
VNSVTCELCGEEVGSSTPHLVLNRLGIGGHGGRSWLQWNGARSQAYLWDQETGRYSGRVLCWPHCACTFLEGLVVEHELESRRG